MAKNILLGGLGLLMVIAGISLTLKDWVLIRMIFSGILGPLLAVAGLVVMSLVKK